MNFLLALSFLQNLVVILFMLVCGAIILIVLLQKGRGGGIGAAFGGGGAGSLLGTKTGDFLTWVTICLVAVFLVLAVLMGKFLRPSISSDLGGAASAPAATTAQPATEIPAADVDTTMPEAVTPDTEQTAPVADESTGVVDDVTETTETPAEEPAN